MPPGPTLKFQYVSSARLKGNSNGVVGDAGQMRMPGSTEDPGGLKQSSSFIEFGWPFSNGILYSTRGRFIEGEGVAGWEFGNVRRVVPIGGGWGGGQMEGGEVITGPGVNATAAMVSGLDVMVVSVIFITVLTLSI